MAIYRGSGGSVESITESDVVTIAISQGGTGANTASGARSNLGLGTAATTASSDYATAAQGTLADSAVQPGDIGTAAAEDVGYFATAAQGALADSALQSGDIGVAVQAYDAQLADVAGLTPTDNGVIIGNGTNFVVESGSTLRSSLGLAIGTDVLAPNGSAASLTSFPTFNQNTTGTADNVTGVVAIANGGTGQTTAVNARAALLPTYATNAGKVLAVKADASDVEYISVGGTGTVTSVDMSVPTGLSVSGNPVTGSGTLAVTYASGYAIPTTAKQTEWDTAYTDRNKWDGGATGLTAATGRTSLGLGTAATTDATAYATAAQGTNADTAYGWGNHASAGYAADSAVVHDTGDETIAGVKTFSDNIIGAGNLTLNNGNADGAQLSLASSGYSNWNIDNYSGRLRAYYGSTEYFTVNSSGNVGIGTSSPVVGSRLAVVGGGAQISGGTSSEAGIRFHVSSGVATITGINNDNNAYNPIAFYTGASEAARIDTSGIITGTAGNLMLVSGTAASASGTSVDFTNLPSWVKRITVMMNNVSTNGTSAFLVQLGDSGGIENSGYTGVAGRMGSASSSYTVSALGFPLSDASVAASNFQSLAILTLLDAATNTWVITGTTSYGVANSLSMISGGKSLSATLDRVRITTISGNTFDAGTINILYE